MMAVNQLNETKERLVYKLIANITGHHVEDLDTEMYLEGDLGLDSIKMITLMNELMKCIPPDKIDEFSFKYPVESLLALQKVGDIVEILEQFEGEREEQKEENIDSGPDTLEIIPAQYPFLISYYAVSVISITSGISLKGKFDNHILLDSWKELISRHPILQSVFEVEEGANSFKQYRLKRLKNITPPDLQITDLRHSDEETQRNWIKNRFQSLINKKFNIFAWPLHSVEAIRTGENKFEIVLSINHTISDGLGNQQFLKELLEIYSAKIKGIHHDLPQATTPQEYNRMAAQINEWNNPEENNHLETFLREQGRDKYFFNPFGNKKPSTQEPFHGVETKSQLFWITEQTTESLLAQAKARGVSLFVLLVSGYLKTIKQLGENKESIILNLPTGGKVYPNVDATGIMGAFAQNLALTFDMEKESEEWDSLIQRVDREIKRNLTLGIDRAQTYKAAYEAKEHIGLQDGVIPKTVAGFIRSTIKSNLYLSFVGNTDLKERYKDIEMVDYEAYTCTNIGAIDNLIELFHGKIMISSNYDSSFYNEAFINQLINRFILNLKELAAQIPAANLSRPVHRTMGLKNQQMVTQLCTVVEEVCRRPVSPADMDKDLDVFGLDSLQRIRVMTRLEKSIGKFNREALFSCRSLNEMVSVISPDVVNSNENGEIPFLRIAEQCRETPDGIAIEYNNEKITYRMLNERSNSLAHYLRSMGVGMGSLVGIMVHPSPSMVVGLLAILKAGGAYLPLDPTYPLARISYIINQAKVDIFISEDSLKPTIQNLLNSDGNVKGIVYMDPSPMDPGLSLHQADQRIWGEYSIDELDCVNKADDLMTVLYTSGSTGNPKGVMLSHRGYMNRLEWHQNMFQLKPGERVAQKTSFSFDISIWEIFWTLMYGGTICPVAKEVVRNPWRLASWIKENRINIMHFVPSLFGEFVHAIEDESYAFNDLRWLIFSGEALPIPFIQKWIEKYGMSTGLANLYGPTEASIDVTYHIIKEKPGLKGETSIPIGKAIDQVFIKILDPEMRELPDGEVGELWIGGIQLAKGYLNNPEKTEESFKSNPFPEIPGEQIYRTGDLACKLPDGSYEYHGRIDNQIKIRGFRVELGEIESILNNHPRVKEAAVIAIDVDGQKQLVACLSGEQMEDGEMKKAIGEKLPAFMIPHQMVWMPSLPKNPNGKLDRKALLPLLQNDTVSQDVEIIPMAPAQRWLMNYFEPPYRWTGYTRFLYKQPLDLDTFRRAFGIMIDRHDALRSILVRKRNSWVQQILPPGQSIQVDFYNGQEINQEELQQEVQKLIVQSIQELQVDTWPLLKVFVIQLAESKFDITVVGHHLISDIITNQLLFKEMWQIYGQLMANSKVQLPDVKSYKDFVLYVEEQKRSHLEEYVEYWKEQYPVDGPSCHIPADFQRGGNDEESAVSESFIVDQRLTNILLGEAKKVYQSNVYPMLLAPLYKILSERYQQEKVIVSHRAHGRDAGNGQQFFQTVGNFAINYPLGVELESNEEWSSLVRKIKDGLEQVPMGGISYDLVSPYLPSYLYPDQRLTSIRANYLGNRDVPKLSTFEFYEEDRDRRFSLPGQKRISEIEFFFSIVNGKLHIDIEYSKNLFTSSTIKEMGNQYIQGLEKMLFPVVEKNSPLPVFGKSTSEDGKLTGKVALITGGGRGIGRSIALSLANEGAQIAIMARTGHELEETASDIRNMGIKPLIIQADISELTQVQRGINSIIEEFGMLDIVVNNAGITKMGGLLDLRPTEWRNIVQVNLFGTYHVCLAAIPQLMKQKQGKVINIGSDSSFIGYPLMSAYAASKHGVLGLTKSLSEELKPYNIQVNAVCPAMVDTDMIPDAYRNKAISPENVADVVTFLASSQSDSITGEAIKVYGKQDMYWYGSEKMPMLKAVLGYSANEK